ncbi:MAG: hypothetical protein JF627_04185 [Alphaproteobacteria bacterium]|nr:hypothetical protein [Alphaproteobacteria bacterium]
MLRFSSVLLAAGLLVLAVPARAADQPSDDTRKTDTVKDAADAAKSQEDDNTLSIIVIEHSPQAVPNPYGNPGPRLMSDAWAVRT